MEWKLFLESNLTNKNNIIVFTSKYSAHNKYCLQYFKFIVNFKNRQNFTRLRKFREFSIIETKFIHKNIVYELSKIGCFSNTPDYYCMIMLHI